MTAYLEIIRWKNLLFLAFVQWLILHAVSFPLLQTFGFKISDNSLVYWLLIASTAFITAGGYVINDYFDVKIDRINHPEKVIVGEKIPLGHTMRYYQVLTGTGILFGLTVSAIAQSLTLGLIFLLTPGLLWFYSASYKRQFVIGNLIVALTTALSVFVVAILVVAQLKIDYGMLLTQTPVPKSIYGWTGGFAGFAFLLTWVREIIKDMEDLHGDRELECRTMPIKWGISKTKIFIYALIVLTIGALFLADHYFILFENDITARYIIFGLTIPLLVLAYLIFKAKDSPDFHRASTLSKYIMLVGILYALVFYYVLAQKFGISFFNLFLVK
ncbi:MAG: geranylgeranylglycerol-phosphate geranylgeranyltransferase [Paludibacteraceae bacterium]